MKDFIYELSWEGSYIEDLEDDENINNDKPGVTALLLGLKVKDDSINFIYVVLDCRKIYYD